MLPRKDSNLDKEIQNLSCYHYTTRQRAAKLIVSIGATGKLLDVNADRRLTAECPITDHISSLRRQPDFGAFPRGLHFHV